MKIVTSPDQISIEEQMSWLSRPYAIDIESTGLDFIRDELIGVALYVDGKAYYFALQHTADDGVTVNKYLTLSDLRRLLSPVMTQPDQVACLHNSKFDNHFFERYNLPLLSKVFDTLIAAKLLDEDRNNGLKQLAYLVDEEHAKYETRVVYSNFPKGSPFNVPFDDFADYAMRDVIVTYKLWELFRKELAKDSFRGVSMQDVFVDLWSPLIPILREMEAWGFRIDIDRTKELLAEYEVKLAEKEAEVRKEGLRMLLTKLETQDPATFPTAHWQMLDEDDEPYEIDGALYLDLDGLSTPLWRPTEKSKWRKLDFNIASSQQLVELVYERPLNIPTELLVTTNSGEDSVNVDNLKIIKYYLGEATPSYIDVVLEWRKLYKYVNTYLRMFVEKVDQNNRLHGMFNMAASERGNGGTRTGRLSSSNPNLQQIPSRGEIGSECRELFIASEGNVLIVADYSNMETVLMAHYSEDPMLMKAFGEGLDVHSLTGAGQHNVSYEEFLAEYKNGNPTYDKWRRTAKTILFGTSYGMGALKLQRKLLVENEQEYSLDEVRAMLRSFDETYAGLSAWKKRVTDYVSSNGFVVTMYGRKRRLPLALSHDRTRASRAARQGVNAIIQGTCADILFEAMPPLQRYFVSLGGSMVAAVHDEIIAEVPERYAEAAAKVMSDTMVGLVNPKLKCKLKAEAGVGLSWKEAKH